MTKFSQKDSSAEGRKPRCVALNEHGFRCRWPSVGTHVYHGDRQLSAYADVGWVAIPLCAWHSTGKSRYSEKEMRGRRKQQVEALARGSKVSEAHQ